MTWTRLARVVPRQFPHTIAATVLLGLASACSDPDTSFSAEAPSVAQDTVRIIRAAVRWADSSFRSLATAPLVILESTVPVRGPAPREFDHGRRYGADDVTLPFRTAVDSTERAQAVLVCASPQGPRATHLCGREPPWRLVIMSVPYVQGDSAVLGIDLLDVETRYDGGVAFSLLLERSANGWKVARAQRAGEID